MTSFSTDNPFNGPVPETIPLPKSPLEAVLIQIRFPEVLSIANREAVAEFQERIRSTYPLHHLDNESVIDANSSRLREKLVPNWRFYDLEEKWCLSLSMNFIALQTFRSYNGLSDFLHRTEIATTALAKSIGPNLMTRIGVRFVYRITGSLLNRLASFIRPELLGVDSVQHQNIDRSMHEILTRTDVGVMVSRWGSLLQNQSHDSKFMPPIDEPSWFLDIDVFNEYDYPVYFDTGEIQSCTVSLATRAYGFFRWTINEDFLRECGGEI